MSDLDSVLPDFPAAPFANLLPALEKHNVTTADLLTLDVADLGRRTGLPLLDLKRLSAAILRGLQEDLRRGHPHAASAPAQPEDGPATAAPAPGPVITPAPPTTNQGPAPLRSTPSDLRGRWRTVSTLDPTLDSALGGGLPAGYVTEITGESGAAKTQLLLSLLLAAQLPPPLGLGRPSLYVSTESPLPTTRLRQLLRHNPVLQEAISSASSTATTTTKATTTATTPSPPSLDRIFSVPAEDLEAQDHILTYQVPVIVARQRIGLVVIDSVAANYRAEFDRPSAADPVHPRSAGKAAARGTRPSNMAARSAQLVALGAQLRDLARRHDLVVVVANQVADRFHNPPPPPPLPLFSPSPRAPPSSSAATVVKKPSSSAAPPRAWTGLPQTQESPLATRSRPLPEQQLPVSSLPDHPRSSLPEPPPDPNMPPPAPAVLHLDHQQRWFTGWGDDPGAQGGDLKTPSLGLVWSTQVACRVALLKRPVYGAARYGFSDDDSGPAGQPTLRSWRRWLKVVFAPHVAASGQGLRGAVEFEVTMGGLRAVTKKNK